MTALPDDPVMLLDEDAPARHASPAGKSSSRRNADGDGGIGFEGLSPKRDGSFVLALSLSLLLHTGLVALAFCAGFRLFPPSLAFQAGSGGDGVAPGRLAAFARPTPDPAVTPLPTPSDKNDPAQSTPTEQTPDVPAELASALGRDDQPTSKLPTETLFSGNATEGGSPLIGPQIPQASREAMQSPFRKARGVRRESMGQNDASTAAEAHAAGANPAEAGQSQVRRDQAGQDHAGLGGDGIAGGTPTPSARNRPPKYPAEARRLKHEGTVTLGVLVLSSGKVGAIDVLQSSGHRTLDDASVEAVRAWVFEPSTAGGQISECRVRLPIRFVLQE